MVKRLVTTATTVIPLDLFLNPAFPLPICRLDRRLSGRPFLCKRPSHVVDAAIKEPEPSKQRRGSGDVAGERGASQAARSRPANGWDAFCNRVSNKDRCGCFSGVGDKGQYAM
jgi:hypothetical protein